MLCGQLPYGPFFRCRCPSYNKIFGAAVLRTAALDPIGHWSLRYTQLPMHTLCERGYHIAPVLNAPKLQKSSLSGRLGSSSSCTHRAEATPWAKPCSHHSLPSQSTIRARAGGRVGTTPCSLLCYTFLPLLPPLPLLLLLLLLLLLVLIGVSIVGLCRHIHASYI